MNTAEGALRPSWTLNTQGLELFWEGKFSRRQGLSILFGPGKVAAEKDGLWSLAAALQREAIRMLDQSEHWELKAMAHFHLAGIYEMLGDTGLAKQEFDASYALFQDLPANSATRFFLAVPQIELAELEANHGSVDAARKRLLGLHIESKAWDNNFPDFSSRWRGPGRRLNGKLGHLSLEQAHLQNAVSIGNKGYKTLSSAARRWEWRREVEQSYRRLLDIELSSAWLEPVARLCGLGILSLASDDRQGSFLGGRKSTTFMRRKPRRRGRAGLCSHRCWLLRVFRTGTAVAWAVDNRGIRETTIPVTAQELQRLVRDFYSHCSNFNFPAQKVNDEGLRLYQLLLAPLEPQLDTNRTLFIEGDGALSMLPWPAVFTPKGQYLGNNVGHCQCDSAV